MIDSDTLDVFPAYDVRNDSIDDYKPVLSIGTYHTLKHGRFDHFSIDAKGAIGAYLSHYTVWEHIAERDNTEPGVFVLEDDARITEPLELKADEADADVVFLHWGTIDNYPSSCSLDDVSVCYSALAYYMTPAFAKRIVEAARPPITGHVDMVLFRSIDYFNATAVLRSPLGVGKNLSSFTGIEHQALRRYNPVRFYVVCALLAVFVVTTLLLVYKLKTQAL